MIRTIFIIFLFSHSALAQVNLDQGLIAYYPFSGNANDMSGNNNHPSFNNATLTTDRSGNPNGAYYFNGTTNFIRIPSNASLNPEEITLCAIVRPMRFYYGLCYNNCIINKGNVEGIPGAYSLRYTQAAFTNNDCNNPDTVHQNFTGYAAGNPGATLYTPYVTSGSWYCVVYTVSADSVKVYVDGVLKWGALRTTSIGMNGQDLYLGKMDNAQYPYWFCGVMDEIRIYDRALNPAEVTAFCAQQTTSGISGIINTYTPVISIGGVACKNAVTVEDGSTFNIGDTVLLIQMKGAVIDSTNTASFGLVTDYKNSGNYEFNYIKNKSGNILEFGNNITKQYDLPNGKVQLVRVPYFKSAAITSTLTCPPWNGSTGGVLVLNVQDTITLNADIDVTGKGFRGAQGFNPTDVTLSCHVNGYNFPLSSNANAGRKGESITTISNNIICGKGSPAGGGGGGLGHNSGGGGGGNGGTGGFGGYQLDNCGNFPFENRGIGGKALTYSSSTGKIFLGSGGGAGEADNTASLAPSGGNGGGIVFLIGDKIKTNSFSIRADGNPGLACVASNCHDGMGGGGAGGIVILNINQFLDNSSARATGGNGANMVGTTDPAAGKIGPGGGGGGGVILMKTPSLPSQVTLAVNGGSGGVLTQGANNPYGTTPGANGATLFSYVLPVDNTPFVPNIDSVRIKDSALSCSNFDFKGFGYTNTTPVNSWAWTFGDGGTANTQNATHSYASSGTFNVKLVVTDMNGCKDSISSNVNASFLEIDAGPADTICAPASTVLQAMNTGAAQFSWTPVAFLDDPTLLNPVATPPVTTKFYLTATNAQGCTRVDSVTIEVRAVGNFFVNPADAVCLGDSIQLLAGGGDIYTWQPTGTLSDPLIANPKAAPSTTTIYLVDITDTVCNNTTTLSTTIDVLDPPSVNATRSNDIDCTISQSQLAASGAVDYSWLPAATLNDAFIPGPIATPVVTTLYTVTGTDMNGCVNTDTVTVKVNASNQSQYLMPTAFTPNGDGKNDCYGIKYWGVVEEIEFSIYNRWGERIFYTKDPTACWDGNYKGARQGSAVFVYMIKAKTTCVPEVFRKGTFTLIR